MRATGARLILSRGANAPPAPTEGAKKGRRTRGASPVLQELGSGFSAERSASGCDWWVGLQQIRMPHVNAFRRTSLCALRGRNPHVWSGHTRTRKEHGSSVSTRQNGDFKGSPQLQGPGLIQPEVMMLLMETTKLCVLLTFAAQQDGVLLMFYMDRCMFNKLSGLFVLSLHLASSSCITGDQGPPTQSPALPVGTGRDFRLPPLTA